MEEAPDDSDLRPAATPISLPTAGLKLAGSDQRALFIIGAPRSGTTLLYKLMCLHPDSAWISNYHRRMPAFAPVAALNRLPAALPDSRAQAWFGDGQAYRYGSDRNLAEWAFPAPVEGEPFFAACGLTIDGEPSAVSVTEQQRRLRRRVRSLCRAHGGSHFVSKRIAHNQRLPLLADTFPQARFVHLVRDGRSVASSLRNVDWWPTTNLVWFGGTPVEWEAAGRDPWQAAAQQWVYEIECIEAGLSAIDPALVIELRYEELVAAPQGHLDRIAEFAELPSTPEMQRVAASLARSDTDPTLDGPRESKVVEVQKSTLERLGYGEIR